MNTITPFLNLWLLGVGFLLLIFLGFLSGFVRAIQSKRWPQTQGQVTESKVVEHSTADPNHVTRRHIVYEPCVSYTYKVGNQAHSSRQIAMGVLQTSEADADKVIARYPVGAKVAVFHDPKRPELAVLEPGRWVLPLVATIIGGVALCFIVFIWINKSQHPNVDPLRQLLETPSSSP
jgi:Protein of unknown function (DUF3592)